MLVQRGDLLELYDSADTLKFYFYCIQLQKEHNIRRVSEQKLWNKKVGIIEEIITDSNEIKTE